MLHADKPRKQIVGAKAQIDDNSRVFRGTHLRKTQIRPTASGEIHGPYEADSKESELNDIV